MLNSRLLELVILLSAECVVLKAKRSMKSYSSSRDV
ncbi:hypothetical protein APH_0652 [Anaplasma phagocytophilum str. HZ]|uniref:Uncharacterized protein n=1 Tax=Anaplasma phagocytophilum (strain HZ) TaxID=212042 RepID=Q2GK67_ANAPZ|nr:hypothetical protein APH_0652 [Anaplasma phagocytophilum str. HZ]